MIRTLFGREFLLAAVAITLLTGCPRDDEIIGLAPHPQKKDLAAVIAARRGLAIVDLTTGHRTPLTTDRLAPESPVWTSSTEVAVTLAGPPYEVLLVADDGRTTTFPKALEKTSNPISLPDATLLALRTSRGVTAFTTLTTHTVTTAPITLRPTSCIFSPRLSPNGKMLAWTEFNGLKPVVMLTDFSSSDTASHSILRLEKPLDILPSSLAWMPDSASLAFLSNLDTHSKLIEIPITHSAGATTPSLKIRVANLSLSAAQLTPLQNGHQIIVGSEESLLINNLDTGAHTPLQAESLNLTKPILCADGSLLAVAENQILVHFRPPFTTPQWVLPTFESSLVLADELFRAGRRKSSARIFEALHRSVRGAEDPRLLQLLDAANMARLGNPREAALRLQKMVEQHRLPLNVPEADIWKLLGMTRLIADTPEPSILAALNRYESLRSAAYQTDGSRPPVSLDDIALNTLAILRTGDQTAVKLFTAALRARLEGGLTQTINAYTQLLQRRPTMVSVQTEYLRALGNVERDIFRLGPSQAPFVVPPATQISYLELFDRLCPDSPHTPEVVTLLLQLYFENARFASARALVLHELSSERATDMVAQLTAHLESYLETPETMPWLPSAVNQVLLDPTIRDTAQRIGSDAHNQFIWATAALHTAIDSGNLKTTEAEMAKARSALNQLRKNDAQAHSDTTAYHAHLLTLEAVVGQLRGDRPSLSARRLRHAASMLATADDCDYEVVAETLFQADMLEHFHQHAPDLLADFIEAQRFSGNDLFSPTWERRRLLQGLEAFLQLSAQANTTIAASTTPTLTLLAGVNLAKLKNPEAARAAFLLASDSTSPSFVRQKTLIERAALDELENDPWSAAQAYSQIPELPNFNPVLADWVRFQQARLHLSLNHETEEAVSTLKALTRRNPHSILGVRAEQLLDETSSAQDE